MMPSARQSTAGTIVELRVIVWERVGADFNTG